MLLERSGWYVLLRFSNVHLHYGHGYADAHDFVRPNGCLPQDCEIELVRFSGLFRGSIKEHFKQGAAGLPAFLFRMEEE